MWLVSLGFILFSFIIGKVAYWIVGNCIKKVTEKTKTNLDDLLIELVERPVVTAFMVSGIYFSISLLELPELVTKIFSRSYSFVIALLGAWLISRFFEAFHRSYLVKFAEKTDSELDDQLMPIIRKGVNSIIWITAIIIGLNNAGYDVGAMIAGLGIGGLALAMASKDTVANVFGGFTIFTDQPFKLNDRIQIAGYDGTVQEVGIRSTRIKTLDGRMVTMPNAKFADAPVENVTAEPSRKIVLNLGLTYDTNHDEMQKGMDILKEIAEKHPHTEENILVGFNGFGDFSLNIIFIYYISKDGDILQTQTDINMEILKRFGEEKLDFAFPTQTLYNIPQK